MIDNILHYYNVFWVKLKVVKMWRSVLTLFLTCVIDSRGCCYLRILVCITKNLGGLEYLDIIIE